jgi:predicted Zn-dependent protease
VEREILGLWGSVGMPLEKTDQQHLERAQGYSALGMFLEANEELEEITPDVRHVPEVLVVRSAIYHGTGRWSAMAVVAAKLVEFDPTEPGWFINLAYATRRAESLENAHTILLRAEKIHPQNGNIQFNIACYQAQLGNIESAKQHLARATRMNSKFRQLALDDSDLESLWEHVRSLE